MSQPEEKLGALLSDEEGRQRFLQLASMLSGSGASSSEPPPAGFDENTVSENYTSDFSQSSSSSQSDKTSALLEVLPKLLQAMSGNGEGLDSKKINLIRALSPYLNSNRTQYIDRAIRMASVAKAAKDTLGMLGR